MASSAPRSAARVMDWEALRNFAAEKILQWLQSSPGTRSAANLHEQYHRTYNILHLQYRRAVRLSMIGMFFNVTKATIRWHYQSYMARAAMPRESGRPPILSPEEYNDFIGYIAEAYGNNCPRTMHNMVRCIGEHYGKVTNANSVRHMLARDPDVKSCQGTETLIF
jgi:hypothetical protein